MTRCDNCGSRKQRARIVDASPIETPIINPMREVRCVGCGDLKRRRSL